MHLRGLVSPNYGLGSSLNETVFQQMMKSRVNLLQCYNLWHEDRTSSAQGVEVTSSFSRPQAR